MDNKKNWSNPWSLVEPVKGRIRFAMVLNALSGVVSLAIFGCFMLILDNLFYQKAQPLVYFIIAAVLLTIINYLLKISAFHQSHLAAFRLEVILRTRLAEKFSQVSLGYLQQQGSGALSKVMFEDINELHIFVADSTPFAGKAYSMPIFAFIILCFIDIRMALVCLLIMLASFGLIALIRKDFTSKMDRYNQAREQVSNTITEYVQAMPVVRAFDSGSASFTRYQTALAAFREIILAWHAEVQRSGRITRALFNAMPTLLILLWLGSYLLWYQQLNFTVWVSALIFGVGMIDAITPLMMLSQAIEKIKLNVFRLQQCLHQPTMQYSTNLQPQDSTIIFENVSFAYNLQSPVLHNISFSVPAGTVTALVGPSGAGKTTVARLIPRFWDVSSGRILVGGVDIRQMSSDTLMQQIAFVFQDTFLFATSILENIRLGHPQATDAEVILAAKAAQADEFISALPQGYQTQAGDRGIFLSGGQRQRITIARAILQNRPILVLDEATAFADPENEAAIVAALSVLMQDKTVIVIAHRLSTITDVDQILVLDQGKLIEQGSHTLLLAQQGLYNRLWQSYIKAKDWTVRGTR